jgi:2'-5' RNA ligase
MSQEKDKYSLWLVPKGEAGETIQALVDKLSGENDAPHFVPHLTLVANIYVDPAELEEVSGRIKRCAEQISPFTVSLTGYGYTEEEFRCLYLLAEGEDLRAAYEVLSGQFPQVSDEHFQAMPHISVLYGKYSQDTKDKIIAENPLVTTEFTVNTFDLYLTNNPVENWRLSQSFPLLLDA